MTSSNKIKRYESLDYLRGLMALSVMIYHYVVWENIKLLYPFDQMILRLGVYAVSIFYIVSGATLSIVYIDKKIDKQLLHDFTIRRLFRIAPLFYFACTLNIAFALLQNIHVNGFSIIPSFIYSYVKPIILNFSLLFAWFSPNTVIPRGGWSIGNELVFYSVLFLLLLIRKKSFRFYFAVLLLIFIGGFSFSYLFIDSNSTLVHEWNIYANPLNQIYFFIGGLIIGIGIKKGLQVKRLTLLIIISCIGLIFSLLPFSDDSIQLVTGWGKFIFSSLMFVLCFVVGIYGKTSKSNFNKMLNYLGEKSYSIYLMHPLVYFVVSKLFIKIPFYHGNIIKVTTSIIITLFIVRYVYKFIEKPFIRISRTWTFKKMFSSKKATQQAM